MICDDIPYRHGVQHAFDATEFRKYLNNIVGAQNCYWITENIYYSYGYILKLKILAQ